MSITNITMPGNVPSNKLNFSLAIGFFCEFQLTKPYL